MTKDEIIRCAIDALEAIAWSNNTTWQSQRAKIEVDAIKEALAQPEQEPMAYDKTELNCFAQDLYDQKMREGKRGHYESMFHVIHQCIKKVATPQREPLTDEEIWKVVDQCKGGRIDFARAIEAAHGIKE